jgi:hypothetical protein
MPQPFRAIAPPPVVTEKLLLLQSEALALAFGVELVQEVLLSASVIKDVLKDQDRSVTNYRDQLIPVIYGKKACPEMIAITLALIKIPTIKGGLVAIACTNIPSLVAIISQDWQSLEVDTSPWQSDGKVYSLNGVNYSHIIGIIKTH